MELGDQDIGTQTFHEAMVWNLETIEANVVARVDGDPSVQLVAAPGRIFPSRELSNPDAKENKFRLVFSPTKRGPISATLHVLLDWRAGAHKPLELAIPIKGAAHAAGTPTLDEEAAQEARRAQQQREVMERSSDEKRREAREDEDWKTHRVHGDEHSREALEAATVGARIALDSLFQNRVTGVDTAKDEAKNYVQARPSHEESLLASLAMAGLEFATAGIAGAIAKRLEGPLVPRRSESDRCAAPGDREHARWRRRSGPLAPGESGPPTRELLDVNYILALTTTTFRHRPPFVEERGS